MFLRLIPVELLYLMFYIDKKCSVIDSYLNCKYTRHKMWITPKRSRRVERQPRRCRFLHVLRLQCQRAGCICTSVMTLLVYNLQQRSFRRKTTLQFIKKFCTWKYIEKARIGTKNNTPVYHKFKRFTICKSWFDVFHQTRKFIRRINYN